MAAQQYQVMCINKRGSHYAEHERIQAIGGVRNGLHWKHTEDQAIRNIEQGLIDYFVSVGGHVAWLVVAVHNGRKYLKTRPDGYRPDNLLALPECP